MLLQKTRAIREISRKEPFEKPIRLLTSVPGIGVTTAATLMVEIDDIARFGNADHLASFIGLVPMCHSSGDNDAIGDITVCRLSCSGACWWKRLGLPSGKTRQ